MSAPIIFKQNTATAAQVLAHLVACDDSFVPPLSTRVDCAAYAAKITSLATCIEAWDGPVLVGLAALYCNQGADAFLSNLSVLPGYQQRGLGSALMQQCMTHALGLNIAELNIGVLTLEVDKDNHAAIDFYGKHGFSVIEKGAVWRMQRKM
ncbi:MAG: GNAT family N-acetyltransferase [Rickettsiales bacterium]|nr:GNAT family N-acetyltransferase [Rickettsiales bacterium]